ncbi:hypothetical protein Rhopal_005730-T1 [Rhodotorula paludigena]|uniref:Patatin-like phospholipase domain-containing protein n=1 Tax=Rhodotorula paludigena TaxID=86838 RepID=A0AAV5GS12_9BASI|nr:hypothetical protein Rhopal_005730-T1 [Rhodotorula paludigena]
MDADLSRPPEPRAGAPPPSRPTTLSAARNPSRRNPSLAGQRGQFDPTISRTEEWDRFARSLDVDWVSEDDMRVFAQALKDDNNDGTSLDQPEKIIAASDWAPVKDRKRKSGKPPRKRKDVVREGWAYHISRWPLLVLIFAIIFLEFVTYLVVRQCVNVIEFFAGWRGERGRLRLALRNAKTYDEWKQRAVALDTHLGLNHWKSSAPNAYYDAPLIRRVVRTLRALREAGDAEGVCAVLHACVRNNFGGVESFRLYAECYYGTKELVQEYIDEVTRSLEYVRHVPESLLPLDEKADFFRSVAKNLGASALCLSGGASFGYYHFGVVRGLLDEGLLPRVITGTSAGAIVAAFCCTRTDDELRELLTPTLADRITACEESTTEWMKRAWRTGARFDTVQWARKAAFFTMGNMTFREAFERTGRILNCSVIPYDTHSPTKLLNYLTAPDCVIYTAVIASAAVPGILNPVVLLRKDKDGKLHPWEFQGKHKDGSLRVDIPLHALHLLYNVNFSIVSQVNPHIHLFHFSNRGAVGRPVSHRRGRGWRGGFFLSAAEQFCKIELIKWFRVIRDLELLPEFGGQNWSGVFLQKFEGTVTIWPKSRFKDWFRILTDPDRDELARMIRVGQVIKMIDNRLKIERQIDLGRDELRRALNQPTTGQPLASTAAASSNGHLAAPPLLRHDSSGELLFPRSSGGNTSSSGSGDDVAVRASTAPPPSSHRAAANVDGSAPSSSRPELAEEPAAADSPAQRRQKILARLGLRGAAGRGTSTSRGQGSERAGESGGERYTGDEAEEGEDVEGDGAWDDEQLEGESGGKADGAPDKLRRRLRRASLNALTGLSSDEDWR